MPHNPQRAFGDRIRELRKKADLTLGDVAEKLGISVVYLSDVERGRRAAFRRDLLVRLAEVIGADSKELQRLAAEARGAFEVESDRIPPDARDFVAGLARGEQYSDDFWKKVLELAKKRKAKE